MPTAETALPGRDTPMPLNGVKHYVFGNALLPPFPPHFQRCVFGNGCFWGPEVRYWELPGVWSTAVGYCGGLTPNPTYEEVCSGKTGHNEVVSVVWDPARCGFADLLKLHWESHDPTQGMGQGNDRGTQYRSAVYCETEAQAAVARASLAAYQGALGAAGISGRITTEVLYPAPEFFFAEDYHQQYLVKPGSRPYCSAVPTEVDLPAFAGWGGGGDWPELGPKVDPAWWAKNPPGCHLFSQTRKTFEALRDQHALSNSKAAAL
eukprot:SAG22_NODE_2601_length_2397_cov_15.406440_2_plen_263_part_00